MLIDNFVKTTNLEFVFKELLFFCNHLVIQMKIDDQCNLECDPALFRTS